jgi:hypothetical protein
VLPSLQQRDQHPSFDRSRLVQQPPRQLGPDEAQGGVMTNRVTNAITALTSRIDALDAETLSRVTAAAEDAPEAALRQMMTEAHAAGVITLDEANTLYGIAQDWTNSPVAHRVIWYQMAAELAKVAS